MGEAPGFVVCVAKQVVLGKAGCGLTVGHHLATQKRCCGGATRRQVLKRTAVEGAGVEARAYGAKELRGHAPSNAARPRAKPCTAPSTAVGLGAAQGAWLPS